MKLCRMAGETLHLLHANLMQPICSNLEPRVAGYDKGPKNQRITVAQPNDCSSTDKKDVKNFIIWLAYHLTALVSSFSSRQFTRKGNLKPPTPIGS